MSTDRFLLRQGIADLIDAVDPDLAARLDTDADAHVRLVALTAELREQAAGSLGSAVTAARAAGVSWDRIGDTLHISRQAAQQRFGLTRPDAAAEVWRLEPVTAFTEMRRLADAGRHGWHSIGFGAQYHDLVRSDRQWEHRRVLVLGAQHRLLEADGWERVGTMWFPWAYYARPLDEPALEETGAVAIDAQ